MTSAYPLAVTAGDPPARAHRMSPKVRAAIVAMVWGRPDDADCKALKLADAAALAGLKPFSFRTWLERPEGRACLLAERREFSEVCLRGQFVRHHGHAGELPPNEMCKLRAAMLIEDLFARDAGGRVPGEVVPQQFSINIVTRAAPPHLADREPFRLLRLPRSSCPSPSPAVPSRSFGRRAGPSR